MTSTDIGLSVDSFLEKARAFLEAVVPDHVTAPVGPVDRQRIALFPDLTPDEERRELAAAMAWRNARFDAGFGWITGPPEFGGSGLSPQHDRAYVRLERQFELPSQRLYDIGLGMVAPTLQAWGTDAAKSRYLRDLYRGSVVGCQLFSEPGAGSDLAGIACRAERDGDSWRITGQKVWSSGAHLSHVGLLVCRTGDPDARHRNLTAFLLPMETEGVIVRPIRQMTGGSSFNEVFLDNVVVGDELRLGAVDDGWSVVIGTLMNERAAVGSPAAGGLGIFRTERLAELLGRFGRLGDGAVRDELMRLHCSLTVARLTRMRSEARRRAGQRPGPEMSVGKVALSKNLAALCAVVGRALGPRLVADSGEPDTYEWAELLLGVPGMRIGGGTDEIQKNILAERVLGLPRTD